MKLFGQLWLTQTSWRKQFRKTHFPVHVPRKDCRLRRHRLPLFLHWQQLLHLQAVRSQPYLKKLLFYVVPHTKVKEIVRTGKVVGSVTRCLTDLFSLFTIFIIIIKTTITAACDLQFCQGFHNWLLRIRLWLFFFATLNLFENSAFL